MTNYLPARRNVLRGLIAASCALWLHRGIAAESSAGKISKTQAKYQDQPKGDQNCAGCMHFIPGSNTCKLVEGNVAPTGWCTLWAKKPG